MAERSGHDIAPRIVPRIKCAIRRRGNQNLTRLTSRIGTSCELTTSSGFEEPKFRAVAMG